MIKKYSRFSHLLMIVLVFAVAGAGCGKGCLRKGGGVDPSSLELIPAENNVIIGMSWNKISTSPLGEKIKGAIPPEAAPLIQDIDGAVIGMSIKSMEKDTPDFIGIVSGKLDSTTLIAKLAEQIQKDGATVQNEDYEGVKLYSSSKDAQFAVAFFNNKGVFGSKEAVKKAVDLSKKKGDSVEKNKEVLDLIHDMDTGKMFWAVGAIPPGIIPAGGSGPMASLSNLKAIDLAVDFTHQLEANLGILTGAKENAQQLTTMINSYKTLFGTSLAMKDPNLGKLINGLTIDSKDARVNLSLKLDRATVEELTKQAKEKQEAKVQPGVPPVPESMPTGTVQ